MGRGQLYGTRRGDRDAPHKLQYVTRQALRGGRPVSTNVLDADPMHASHCERYR